MVFSSLIFLLGFLPLVLAVYFLLPGLFLRNWFLLLASLLFYAWGDITGCVLMIFSIFMNYAMALGIGRFRQQGSSAKIATAAAIIGNLLLLGFYKYSNFAIANINWTRAMFGMPEVPWNPVALPIGISFFTFQAMSYIFDVYFGRSKAQKDPMILGLHIALFPQLIAGPIVRYHYIVDQLVKRNPTIDTFGEGIRRFACGLGKKVLIANVVAIPADKIFNLPPDQVGTSLAWFATICYTLQIYFDFSGYSDMAIGLGLMFGFRFEENFNYPYTASSIRDFWKRWHISLSKWFMEYVYIPLGGNRLGNTRTFINLLLVFLTCGLWHGAAWTFVVWGLFHGAFIGIERMGLGAKLSKLPAILQHAYVLLIVMIGWVIFRSETLNQAMWFLRVMFLDFSAHSQPHALELYINNLLAVVIPIALLACTPVFSILWKRPEELQATTGQNPIAFVKVFANPVIRLALVWICLAGTLAELTAGAYSPFLYYRF